MKVAILDIDSKIPNLALMKISASVKANGGQVDFFKYERSAYPSKTRIKRIAFYASAYDKVYASIIFTTNAKILSVFGCKDVEIGGSGYDLKKELPKDVDSIVPDYAIYQENKNSYGFITRGCIRNCYFCFVPTKEGYLRKYDTVANIVNSGHKSVIFMDNNILAYKHHKKIFKEIIDKKLKLQFNQGLDIRLIDDENARLLSKMRYIGEYIFAFDSIDIKEKIEEKYKIVKKYIKSDWKIKFFIYCHPQKTTIESIKSRIKWCYDNKALPYIMRDFDCYNDKNSGFYTDIAAWCNQPGFFKNMEFEQFVTNRNSDKKRVDNTKKLWGEPLHPPKKIKIRPIMKNQMYIYIPSLGRSDSLKTGQCLPDELAPFVRVVVHTDEEAEYAEAIGSKFIMPTKAKGIANVRQWILENSLSRYSLFLDDDMSFNYRDRDGKLPKCSRRRFGRLYKLLSSWLEEGFAHVGISQRAGNNRVQESYVEVTRMNNAYAYDVETVLKSGARFDRLKVMEDFDITLSLLRAGYPNRVTYDYCWSQGKSGAAGGCSGYRNFEVQHQAAHALNKLHPGLVRIVTKRAKVEWEGIGKTRTDVVISWKKAFSPAGAKKGAGIGAFLK